MMLDHLKELAAKVLTTGRWAKAYTQSGRPAGLRFECEKCHLVIEFEAPERVFHCGHEEEVTAVARHLSDVPEAILEAAGRTGRADDMTAIALRGSNRL